MVYAFDNIKESEHFNYRKKDNTVRGQMSGILEVESFVSVCSTDEHDVEHDIESTKVTYIMQVSLGGMIPQSLVEMSKSITVNQYVGERASRSNTRRGNHTAFSNRTLCDRQVPLRHAIFL